MQWHVCSVVIHCHKFELEWRQMTPQANRPSKTPMWCYTLLFYFYLVVYFKWLLLYCYSSMNLNVGWRELTYVIWLILHSDKYRFFNQREHQRNLHCQSYTWKVMLMSQPIICRWANDLDDTIDGTRGNDKIHDLEREYDIIETEEKKYHSIVMIHISIERWNSRHPIKCIMMVILKCWTNTFEIIFSY